MKNVYEILKKQGIEIDAEKKEAFDKEFNENYKTITEVNKLNTKLSNLQEEKEGLKSKYDESLKKRDTDLEGLRKQLDEAGTEKEKLDSLNSEFSKLQDEYKNAKTQYEKDLAKQRYEFAIKEKANGLKFTSKSAKELFLQKAFNKELQMENDSVLGFDDFVDEYKRTDAEAFVIEKEEEGDGEESQPKEPERKPHIVGRANQVPEDKPEPKEVPSVW